MVLDPLTAFSLACNVIQVVETGCKILSGAADYRRATDGALTEQRELREVSRTLNNLSNSLQSTLLDSSRATQPSADETRLLQANVQCLELSRRFMDLLDKLEVKNLHASWESLRMSIKARWYKDRMDNMSKTLSEARNNLNIALLLYMNAQQPDATSQMQIGMRDSTNQVEQSILSAVDSASGSIQEEIRLLAERLKETYLDSNERSANDFAAARQKVLTEILAQLKSTLADQEYIHSTNIESRYLAASQKILDSLYFDQMQHRHEHVREAHAKTCQWILEYKTQEWQRWDCFRTWLQAADERQSLYWIHGKPGSGKSTLMKFLDSQLTLRNHEWSWVTGMPISTACYFFWNAGSPLQSSSDGLYRSLLFQCLEQRPKDIRQVILSRKWLAASSSEGRGMNWSDPELRQALTKAVQDLGSHGPVLLLVDGLDELEGTDEERDDLAQYLLSLAGFKPVKLCVSSRPWNIFQDAFSHCPQLRLEDFTCADINAFVKSQLKRNSRWQFFEAHYPEDADDIIRNVVKKAGGVFLWVHLVVRDLLQGLQDGDNLARLQLTVTQSPADLDDYFMRMIESIPQQHRREASAMLQLMLHTEEEFVSVHEVQLLDMMFIVEGETSFRVTPGDRIGCLDLLNQEALLFNLDSTLRKLNSRCKGLLECSASSIGFSAPWSYSRPQKDPRAPAEFVKVLDNARSLADPDYKPPGQQDMLVLEIFSLDINFLHRSLQDFLLTPKIQNFLHKHTDGPLDARIFLCRTWLIQLTALLTTGICQGIVIGLASHLLSALSVNRLSQMSVVMASVIENAFTEYATNAGIQEGGGYYISTSLLYWRQEKSTFLTLAIDFRLTAYVVQQLNAEAIRCKVGRPILDYLLRPRFAYAGSELRINNRWPDMDMLDTALNVGGDPNEVYAEAEGSVWALFILSMADILAGVLPDDPNRNIKQLSYFHALEAMVNAGAEPLLPRLWLLCSSWDYDFETGCASFTSEGEPWMWLHEPLMDFPHFQ